VLAGALHEEHDLTVLVAPQRRRLAVEQCAANADAAKLQRHGKQAFLQEIHLQFAVDQGAAFFQPGRVLRRDDGGRQRDFHRRFGCRLGDQLLIFLPREEGPLGVAFEDDVEVLEGDEDFADFVCRRRRLGRHLTQDTNEANGERERCD
jgi:hypothetical protein